MYPNDLMQDDLYMFVIMNDKKCLAKILKILYIDT